MKLTQADGSLLDTNTATDATALFLEKAKELHDLCVTYKIPSFILGLAECAKSTSLHTFAHPTETDKSVALTMLTLNCAFWNKMFPDHEMALVARDLTDEVDSAGFDA